MSSSVIHPGFTGFAKTGTDYLRFATCSLNANQEVEAPDMVMGDYTHNAWAYGKIEVAGQISGPLTENSMNFIDALWSAAGSTIDVKYYDGYQRQFTQVWANSLTLNVNAGEVAQFTLDLIGVEAADLAADMGWYTRTEKLLTWDKCGMYYGNRTTTTFSGGNLLPSLQSFSITISNNITRQFMIKASDLFGDLVRGMSAVTGNVISFACKSNSDMADDFTGGGANYWDAYTNDSYHPVWFSVGGKQIQCTVVFHRATSELSVGPVLTTIGFTGIGHWGGNNPMPGFTHDAIA